MKLVAGTETNTQTQRNKRAHLEQQKIGIFFDLRYLKSPLFDSKSCGPKITSLQNQNNFYKLFWPKEVLQHIWLASNEGKSFNFADLEKYFLIIIIMELDFTIIKRLLGSK